MGMHTQATNFSALLGALSKTFGLDSLETDETGACVLLFDENLVSLQPDPDDERFTVATEVGTLASDVGSARLENLLAANLFGAGTGGATLGLLKETRRVLLTRAFDLVHLDPAAFEKELETFLNAADQWRHYLGAGDAPAPEPMMPMGIRA